MKTTHVLSRMHGGRHRQIGPALDPDVIAAEIVEELQADLVEFEAVLDDLASAAFGDAHHAA